MKKSLALVLALLSAAVLHAEWGFKSSTVITNGNWEIGVSVKNDVDTTLTSYVAGSGTLDLRKFSEETGCKVRSLGTIFSSNPVVSEIILADADLTTLASYGFQNCYSLQSITPFFPPSVTLMGSYAFQNCTNLVGDLAITNMASVSAGAFTSTRITSARLCEQLVSLNGAFNGCYSLTNVTPSFPPTLESIAGYAFYNCTNLAGRFVLSNQKIRLLENCIFENTAIEDLTIPQSITNIASYFAKNCKALTNVSVALQGRAPEPTPCYIGYQAFYNCPKLATLELPFPGYATGHGNNVHIGSCPSLRRIHIFGPAIPKIAISGYTNYVLQILCSRQQDKAGWEALATPLTEDDRLRETYPGPKTFGTDNSTLITPTAWLVWASSPYDRAPTTIFVR